MQATPPGRAQADVTRHIQMHHRAEHNDMSQMVWCVQLPSQTNSNGWCRTCKQTNSITHGILLQEEHNSNGCESARRPRNFAYSTPCETAGPSPNGRMAQHVTHRWTTQPSTTTCHRWCAKLLTHGACSRPTKPTQTDGVTHATKRNPYRTVYCGKRSTTQKAASVHAAQGN